MVFFDYTNMTIHNIYYATKCGGRKEGCMVWIGNVLWIVDKIKTLWFM